MTYKIDNLPAVSTTFEDTVQGDLLGVDFILGGSVLGSNVVYAPYTVPIEGWGRSIQITVENNNLDDQVEIYGYIIEFEPGDISQEVVQ